MHKTVAEAAAFVDALLPRIAGLEGVDVVICPPFTALPAAVDAARGIAVRVGAQNMHEAESGAFTGEVSTPMLAELGVAARSSATPSAASSSARPTRRWRARSRRARRRAARRSSASARPRPSATRARPRPCCARQLEADLAGVDAARLGRGRHRLRADLGDRHRAHRDPRAGAGGVRVHPRA